MVGEAAGGWGESIFSITIDSGTRTSGLETETVFVAKTRFRAENKCIIFFLARFNRRFETVVKKKRKTYEINECSRIGQRVTTVGFLF